ncbi:LacI family DNA-binding transcriptional regulator [Flavobacterium sp. UMI-01]|uniref:LacI family DNA-binding transcriptional regulator n=1 Tax=Flavobacterium sp. UMI-01 TaxID=1441053 RepID=UPI001C7DB8BC|nr:LacI family DNA-binding transcriptional regulator [Flavobacterium sp. UMI-01]GIZ08890.1 LacI family transcriptional regulator [Flavobacterium sp. UMI-01]
MSEKTTIYDIAKKLDISAATVSRALNKNPKISESTIKLVMETAEKMNYKQNRLALALKSGRSGMIGVIVPRVNTNFFGSTIRGIEEELHPNKYNVIICQTHEDENREIENINTLLDAQVDGIMISITNESKKNEKIIQRVLQKKVPLIFFDRKKNINGVSSVSIDDFNAGYIATQHLIDQGCTRIAHLCGDQALEIYENRFKGYKKALEDNGLEFNEDYVLRARSNQEDGATVTKKLLKLPNPPDAIFSASDFAALGAIKVIKKQGFKIPEDICVMGFGNEPFTKFMELSITTIDQSPLEMGKMAAKVFLEQIQNKEDVTIEKKIVLNPILHIRKSSSRIKE